MEERVEAVQSLFKPYGVKYSKRQGSNEMYCTKHALSAVTLRPVVE